MSAPLILMERSNSGWIVQLRITAEGHPAITLQRGEGATIEGARVPDDKALDAFWHPVCYLPTPQEAPHNPEPLAERLEGYSLRV